MKALLGRMLYYTAGVVALPLFINGTKRTRVALIDKKTQRILLSKTLISSQEWQLVGGGINKNEEPKAAAIREIREESGLELEEKKLENIGSLTINEYMASYEAEVFIAHIDEFEFIKARYELLDMAWFSLDSIPENNHKQTINFVKNAIK